MRFNIFPKREEDVYNLLRLLTVIFILSVLPLSIILTQRETRIQYEAKEDETVLPRPLDGASLEDLRTEYIYPKASGVGWVKSNDSVLSHFGDDDIHAGFWGEDVYLGLLQFDLSSLPENARISGVQISLIGKSDARLGNGGKWQFEILDIALDKEITQMGFTDFRSAKSEITLSPVIERNNLKVAQETSFTFSIDEIEVIKNRFSEDKLVSLRITGPRPDLGLLGEKQEFNLFTWESGYGEGTFKIKPVMEILYTL